MRTFLITDIHGGFKAFTNLLEQVNFNKETDKLICIGDTADGWPEVKECFEELSKIKNLIYLWGNHDLWMYEYYGTTKKHEKIEYTENAWEDDYQYGQLMSKSEFLNWERQGGKATLNSFGNKKLPEYVLTILKNAKNYYIDENDRLFVHGGFHLEVDISLQSRDFLIWDRQIIYSAFHKKVMHQKHGHPNRLSHYKEIFVGHTPTININTTEYNEGIDNTKPINVCNLWMCDTGASYDGKLSMIDITNIGDYKIYQSEPVKNYYPGIKAR